MSDRIDAATRRQLERLRNMARQRPARIEAPGPGQESVWDYPRPPRLEPVAEPVRVCLAGVVLAQSRAALRVCETASPPTLYLPPEDVRMDLLEPTSGNTLCEWKGSARYFSVRVGDRLSQRAAWSYPRPFEGYERLAGYLAFFPGRVDACLIGDERATPQPGEYYGGWVTQKLVGPFKGEPGSEGW